MNTYKTILYNLVIFLSLQSAEQSLNQTDNTVNLQTIDKETLLKFTIFQNLLTDLGEDNFQMESLPLPGGISHKIFKHWTKLVALENENTIKEYLDKEKIKTVLKIAKAGVILAPKNDIFNFEYKNNIFFNSYLNSRISTYLNELIEKESLDKKDIKNIDKIERLNNISPLMIGAIKLKELHDDRIIFSNDNSFYLSCNTHPTNTGQIFTLNGKPIGKPIESPRNAYFSPDNDYYFVSSYNKNGQLYSSDGEPCGPLLKGSIEDVTFLEQSNLYKVEFVMYQDKFRYHAVQLFNKKTGGAITKLFEDTGRNNDSFFTYLPEIQSFFIKECDKEQNLDTLHFFTISGEEIGQPIENIAYLTSPYISPNNKYMFIKHNTYKDNFSKTKSPKRKKCDIPKIAVYTTQGTLIKNSEYYESEGQFFKKANFSPDSNYYYIKSGSGGNMTCPGVIDFYAIKNNTAQKIATFDDAWHCIFSPDSNYFFIRRNIYSESKTTGILYTIKGKKIKEFKENEFRKLAPSDTCNIQFAPNSSFFWAGKSEAINFFSMNGEKVSTINGFKSVKFLYNDSTTCLLTNYGRIQLFNVNGAPLGKVIPYSYNSEVSPDHNYIFAVNDNKNGQLYNKHGEPIGKEIKNVQSIKFADNSQFYSLYYNNNNSAQLYTIDGIACGPLLQNSYYDYNIKCIKNSPFWNIVSYPNHKKTTSVFFTFPTNRDYFPLLKKIITEKLPNN